ncbi:MAG: hypothetical protein IT373_12210 [Polyangiaceae bacterium]|nr:hypothetical protein [Polyangiaceae bacterium]
MWRTALPLSLAGLLLLSSAPAAAQAPEDEPEKEAPSAADEEPESAPIPTFTFGGGIRSDVRFRVHEKAVGAFYDRLTAPLGVARNENLVNAMVSAEYAPVKAVLDLDVVFYGRPETLEGLEELSLLPRVNPLRFDPRAAYVEVDGLFTDGLLLRVGQQLVRWGTARHFNPTDNLNADDVEDPLEYGRQQGNLMLRIDYRVNRYLSHSGVLVPIFRPALLPETANLGWTRVDRLGLDDAALRHRLEAEAAAAAGPLVGIPHVVREIVPELPKPAFENMQVGYRVALDVARQHVALSYYLGRTDFPQAKKRSIHYDAAPVCDPDEPGTCTRGALVNALELGYPRMHAFGLNVAGAIPLDELDEDAAPLDYHLEAALVVPERAELEIEQGALPVIPAAGPGSYDYDGDGIPGGPIPETVRRTPFAKWVVGLSYRFVPELTAGLQWVHGLPEEYGAGDFISAGETVLFGGVAGPACNAVQCALTGDGTTSAYEVVRPRLGDYLTAELDVRLLDDALSLRTLAIFDLLGVTEDYFDPVEGTRVRAHHSMFTPDGFSAVVVPEVEYEVIPGMGLAVGAQLKIGKERTKFGDPAEGGSTVFARAHYQF